MESKDVCLSQLGLSKFLKLIDMGDYYTRQEFLDLSVELLAQNDIETVIVICDSINDKSIYSEIAGRIYNNKKELRKLFNIVSPQHKFRGFIEYIEDVLNEQITDKERKKIINTILSAARGKNKHVYREMRQIADDRFADEGV